MKIILYLSITLVTLSICQSPENENLKLLEEKEGCWLSFYGRGVGKPIRVCDDDKEQSDLLCYAWNVRQE